MWYGHMGPFGVILMIIGLIIFIFFAVLLAIGLIYLLRYIGAASIQKEEKNTALEVAKLRYAKGEISKKEFEELKKSFNKSND